MYVSKGRICLSSFREENVKEEDDLIYSKIDVLQDASS